MSDIENIDELKQMRWYALSCDEVIDILKESSRRCWLALVCGDRHDDGRMYRMVDSCFGLPKHIHDLNGDYVNSLRMRGLL